MALIVTRLNIYFHNPPPLMKIGIQSTIHGWSSTILTEIRVAIGGASVKLQSWVINFSYANRNVYPNGFFSWMEALLLFENGDFVVIDGHVVRVMFSVYRDVLLPIATITFFAKTRFHRLYWKNREVACRWCISNYIHGGGYCRRCPTRISFKLWLLEERWTTKIQQRVLCGKA